MLLLLMNLHLKLLSTNGYGTNKVLSTLFFGEDDLLTCKNQQKTHNAKQLLTFSLH